MSNRREHERALFVAFHEIEPAFAGEPIADWHQPEDERDFPDIIGTTISGRRFGIEIGEWLNEQEIQAAKQKERVEEALLNAIGDQGVNPTQHIGYVWLRPRATRISASDAAGFRGQLFRCILECDQRWLHERFWMVGRLVGDELAPYPLLARYLLEIKLWPKDGEKRETNWITFPERIGVLDRETMLKPLRELVAEKINHYSATRTGFNDLSLLVINNLAAICNCPAEAPLHTFDNAANELIALVRDNHGPFDRVFLYIALTPGRVRRVL